jgi:putative spermidine/putrescine transport system substrate-binding protein
MDEKEMYSRRDFMKISGAAVGALAAAQTLGVRHAHAKEPVRILAGAAVEWIDANIALAKKEMPFPVEVMVMGMDEAIAKIIRSPEEFDVFNADIHLLDLEWPQGIYQPLDIKKITQWGKMNLWSRESRPNYIQERPAPGDAPVTKIYVQTDGKLGPKITDKASCLPGAHSFDTFAYNRDVIKKAPDQMSWRDLLNPQYSGKVAWQGVAGIGITDFQIALEASNIMDLKHPGNLTKKEIDSVLNYIIGLKKKGHFRAFWADFMQSVELITSGEVVIESAWNPAIAHARALGHHNVYPAVPIEGARGWFRRHSVLKHVKGEKLEQVYYLLNWLNEGKMPANLLWQDYHHAIPENVKKYVSPVIWDFFHEGEPASEEIKDPKGRVMWKKGERYPQGSYDRRTNTIISWNAIYDENAYLVKRWSEFLAR